MDRLNPLAIPLHPVTKTWVYAIVALAVMTSMDLVSQAKIIFFPPRMLTEPWRLFTSFCYFGNLEISLLQFIIIIAKTNNSLEEQYLYRIEYMPREWVHDLDKELKVKLREEFEHRKTSDFAFFIARIACSIVAIIAVLSRWCDISRDFLILGPALEKIVLYILCRNSPTEQLDMMGINIMAKYMPFLTQFLGFLFSEDFQYFLKNVHVDPRRAVILFLTSTLVRQTLLVFTIGHLWWFIQFYYLEHAHGESSSNNQEEWSKVHVKFKTRFSKWLDLSNIFSYLLTPPWYYFVVQRLLKEQEHHERLAEIDGETREVPTQEAQLHTTEENDIDGDDIEGNSIEGSDIEGSDIGDTNEVGASSGVYRSET